MEMIHLSPIAYEIIGVVGFGLYVLNYTLLTLRYTSGHDIKYFVINLLAAALIQIFWVVMSLIGITLRFIRPLHPSF